MQFALRRKILNNVARSAPTFGSKIIKHKPTANKTETGQNKLKVHAENLFIRNYIFSNVFEKKVQQSDYYYCNDN